MTTATVHIFEDIGVLSSGHGTTQTDVDAGTVKFGLSDADDASASPISVPATTGNAYSYAKSLYLDVTVAATTSTSLLNRTVKYDSAPTGLNYFWKAINLGSYVQATAAADTTNASANGTAPTGYTAITTSPQTYDSATQSSTATGQNGKYAVIASGASNAYVAGGGLSANTVFTLGYDEQ
jgi:hypothetical protein